MSPLLSACLTYRYRSWSGKRSDTDSEEFSLPVEVVSFSGGGDDVDMLRPLSKHVVLNGDAGLTGTHAAVKDFTVTELAES